MPPKSRRQRKYEEDLRRVRMRNRFALLVGAIALAATGYLVYRLVQPPPPPIYVAIEWVNYSGTREIPFALDSCQNIKQALEETSAVEFLAGNPIAKIDAVESQSLVPGSGRGKALLVYRVGHLTDAASRPVSTQSDSEDGSSDGDNGSSDDVFWIGPEGVSDVALSFDQVLRRIDKTEAKLKILLLDAGRFSWSPTYPGRQPNQFLSALASKLEQNTLGLDENFWVISSHSDHEISQVSTPLKSSLFAQSVSDTIRELHGEGGTDATIDVRQLFRRIRNRTMSYARNFSNRSVQQPVLLKVGLGQVELSTLDREDDASALTFQWSSPASSQEDSSTEGSIENSTEYRWSEYTQGTASSQRFSQWLLAPLHVAALPKPATRRLESFLETGDARASWPPDLELIQTSYSEERSKFEKPFQPTNFDRNRLLGKRDAIDQFRRRVFEFGIWQRFRHQLRFLDDDAFDSVEEGSIPDAAPALSNRRLISSEAPVDNQNRPVSRWSVRGNENRAELLQMVRSKQLTDRALTPYQAELLGVLGQRYLPLLDQSNLVSETPDAAPGASAETGNRTKFELDLVPVENVALYSPGSQTVSEWTQEARQESASLASSADARRSDTALRFFLATRGTESAPDQPGVVPQIAWRPLTPSLTLSTGVAGNRFRVPAQSTKPIAVTLDGVAIEGADLALASDGPMTGEIEFGFDNRFNKSIPLREMQSSGGPFETRNSIRLFVRHLQTGPDAIGKRYSLKLVAKSWSTDANAEVLETRLPLTIEISRDELLIEAKRTFGIKGKEAERVNLYRWNAPVEEGQWFPLPLRTLANVKSPVNLTVRNNSSQEKRLAAKLYRIEDSFDTRDLRIDVQLDRGSRFNAVRNYLAALKKQTATSGLKVFGDAGKFTLLAECEMTLAGNGTAAALPFRPPPGADGKPAKVPDDESLPPAELARGLLLVILDRDAILAEGELRQPDWYQVVQILPEPVGDSSASKQDLRVLPDLLDVIDDSQMGQLPGQLLAEVEPAQAAVLTTINQTAYRTNRHLETPLTLAEIMRDAPLRQSTGRELELNRDAYLLIELLGLPRYLAYKTSGGANVPASFDLVGLRVSQQPEGWKCYPRTWSFSAAEPIDASFQWMAGDPDQEQLIFVDPADDASAEIEVEMMLPSFGRGLLSPEELGFYRRWKDDRGRELIFPNQRRHYLALGAEGLVAWSQIAAHGEKLSNISGARMEISRGQGKVLGRWRFVTESLKEDPEIRNLPAEVTLLESEFANVKLEIDVGKIQPPILPQDLVLSWNDIQIKDADKWLLDEEPGDGKYQIDLRRWMQAAGLKFTDVETGSRIELKVEATDFFGETTEDQAVFRAVEMAKPVVEPKPDPASLLLSLKGESGDEISELRDVLELRIDGKEVRLGRPTQLRETQIRATVDRGAKAIRLVNLPPGKYRFEVKALVKREGSAATISASGRVRQVQLKSGDNEQSLFLY